MAEPCSPCFNKLSAEAGGQLIPEAFDSCDLVIAEQ